ncbi:hypothetical protein TWF694_000983 [Orbilia ellipsospora]|uniref:MARVEL domain-containing protein n=1 Tax=Orbilia ellipsospora TaxID=2528407 RepID=A0AAV9XS32_9PEZI
MHIFAAIKESYQPVRLIHPSRFSVSKAPRPPRREGLHNFHEENLQPRTARGNKRQSKAPNLYSLSFPFLDPAYPRQLIGVTEIPHCDIFIFICIYLLKYIYRNFFFKMSGPGAAFTLIRAFEIIVSIIALGVSGFVAGYPTFSAGSAGGAVAAYLWPAWVAFVTALFVLVGAITILACKRTTATSLGRSVGVLVTDIISVIFLIVSVAGFATVFRVVLESSVSALTSYDSYYSDYYSDYGYSDYSDYYYLGIDLAWYNCIKADMALIVILFILALGAIIVSAIEVHRVQTKGPMPVQTHPHYGPGPQPTYIVGIQPAYVAADHGDAEMTMGPPPFQTINNTGLQNPQQAYHYPPQPMSPPPQQVQVYAPKMQ